MRNKHSIIICTAIGTVIGAGIGMIAAKNCKKTSVLKKTAGRALHAAGSFVEHMSF